MAVTYMKKLEQEPSTYESGFTALTKGVNVRVHEWISSRVEAGQTVLEVGCGPGTLAGKMAQKGCVVTAVDANPAMIEFASKNQPINVQVPVVFRQAPAQLLPGREGGYDAVVCTFLLSEMGPLAQQLFLRAAWQVLRPGGMLYIAEEFVPGGVHRIGFTIKRWWYRTKLKRQRVGLTHPLSQFISYLAPIGFAIQAKQEWASGAIRVLATQKNGDVPGYYQPQLCQVTGFKAWMRVARCILTGQIDHVAIEPGLYASGKPTPESPILVTANYYYTFFCLMRDLRGIDAWVLCVDSRGINVWCAARGGDLGNAQLLEAVNATGLTNHVSHFKLILPQLAAGGVAVPQLPPDFRFKVVYGPVWSRDLPQYLREKIARKPAQMRIARFTPAKRLQAGVTHATFLMRKFLFWPTLFLLTLFVGVQWWDLAAFLGWTWVAVGSTALFIALLFPLAQSFSAFTRKSIFFGILSVVLGGLGLFVSQGFTCTFPGIVALLFWLAFFETMSFSGYTMESSPRAIQGEYPAFMKWTWRILTIAICLLVGGALLDVFV